jgi:galactose-1-phosphate uridylyltransferase
MAMEWSSRMWGPRRGPRWSMSTVRSWPPVWSPGHRRAACSLAAPLFANGPQHGAEFLENELAVEVRVVARTEHFVAICPFASRVPYEVRILPLAHSPYFETTPPDQLRELARLVREVSRRIEVATNRGAYNLIIHTAPFDTAVTTTITGILRSCHG